MRSCLGVILSISNRDFTALISVLVVMVLTCRLLAAAEPRFRGRDLSQWIQDIHSGESEVKIRAIRMVGDMGADAGGAAVSLVECLDSADNTVRLEAIMAAGEIGEECDPAVDRIGVLLLIKRPGDYVLRRECAVALAKISERSVDLLASFLKDEDLQRATLAAQGLSYSGLKGAKHVPALIELMLACIERQDFFCAAFAARALGKLAKGRREVLPPLTHAASQKFEAVAWAAIEALTEIAVPDDAASTVMARWLALESSFVGCAAAKYCIALKTREEDARKYLLRALDSDDVEVVGSAARDILELGVHDDAIRKKMFAMSESGPIGKRAAALMSLTDWEETLPSAARELMAMMDRGEIRYPICIQAMNAVAKAGKLALGPKAGIERFLEHDQREARRAAMSCLRAIGG